MSATLGFVVLWGLRRELLCRAFDNRQQEGKVQAARGTLLEKDTGSNSFKGSKANVSAVCLLEKRPRFTSLSCSHKLSTLLSHSGQSYAGLSLQENGWYSTPGV